MLLLLQNENGNASGSVLMELKGSRAQGGKKDGTDGTDSDVDPVQVPLERRSKYLGPPKIL